MDFELLAESNPKPATAVQLLERLFSNRLRQWQIWGENPPHLLGVAILLTVSLEIVLAARLFHNLGAGPAVLPHFFGVVTLFLVAEVLVATIAAKTAELTEKPGNFYALFTYLNLGLTPFLLILPVTLGTWLLSDGWAHSIRLFIYFFVGFKTLSRWKESIEFNYKFSKWQSALAMYMVFGVATVVAVIFIYVSLISAVSNFFHS